MTHNSNSRPMASDSKNFSIQSKYMECDAIVIGAGFGGISAIHRLRQLGLGVKCFEAASGLGGVWRWNSYPGARVDSEVPFYQLNIPEVWQKWHFSERFPSGDELLRYFEFVDRTLGLSKDVCFNAKVIDCEWDRISNSWTVQTASGHRAKARYLVVCTGLLYRTFTPQFRGFESFKGQIVHSGRWDQTFDARGKRVGIIGAGSTAVQITQELGKQANHMTVFVRSPSYCLPLCQRQTSKEEQTQLVTYLPALFKAGRESFTGFPSERPPGRVCETPVNIRNELFERLWGVGGSAFALNNYGDIIVNQSSNKIVYDFWAEKVRSRMKDLQKRQIMAPEQAPYPFGTKRIPLENDYYEVLDQDNVEIVDLSKTAIKRFAETGPITASSDGDEETLHALDAIVLATGFDSFTGSLTNMGLKNKDGLPLRESWARSVHTYLGLMIRGYPNMFTVFAPHAPSALSNGPTCIEMQVDIVTSIIGKMREEGIATLEAEATAEAAWKAEIDQLANGTLFPCTSSWWNAGNIPGKKKDNMLYIGGIARYEAECRRRIERWDGFEVTPIACQLE